MKPISLLIFPALVAAATFAGPATFDARTGALTVSQDGQALWTSGPHGLWRIRFRDGSYLSAADFATNAVPGGTFTTESPTRLVWHSPVADVTVVAEPGPDPHAIDLRAEVTPKRGESLMLDFPAHLSFPATTVKDFVYPGRGMGGPGLALNAKFFLPSSPENPHGWKHTSLYSRGYCHLYGAGLKMQPMDAESVPLSVTPEGNNWFRSTAIKQLVRWKRPVIRPCAPGQSDFVLIDSPLGPYLSAKRFGGSGALWRFGVADGGKRDEAPPAETYSIRQLLPRLAERAPSRTKVALIALTCGPRNGSFVRTSVADWRRTLSSCLPPTCTFEELHSLAAIRAAATSSSYLLILNPYGESFPAESPADLIPRLDDLRAYVKAGGNWVECGGYSFYSALHGGSFLSISAPYPPLFADFAHLTTTSGQSVTLYGVQPRPKHEPWQNPTPFVPGETGVGGGPNGGWFFHAFAAYANTNATARTPRVRIRTGATLDAALKDYSTANTLTMSLAEKVPQPDKLDKLKRAPLLHMYGTAAEVKEALSHTPVPSLYHPANYLKGGFDKEYPDHLPPNPRYGTMAELVDLYRYAQSRGHLVSPYTNPTWWCDHPRGPSFIAAGEAPLSIGLNGKPYHEQYAKNDGWTICFWHPDVQKANRKTVREFTEDAPVDVLFQDQCGARAWRWDFNPAAPSPTAYAEGMVAMNEEDSRRVPLGTEDGWDQVCNRQTAICGCSWRVVPTEGRPAWRDQYKDVYPPDTWRIEPVNLRLFHDKALFYMHDLGAFVTNEKVLAWMFALGYNLSYNPGAKGFPESPHFKWYEWLHVLQSKVVARIAGQPLVSYYHDRSPLASVDDPVSEADDGIVTARWGDVSVAVNLGDVPRTVAGHTLAPYGWWIEGPNLRSAHLDGAFAFVETDGRRWVYGPDPAHEPVHPTEAQRTRAACDRPDAPHTVAVLDFKPRLPSSYTLCSPAEWIKAFEKSAKTGRDVAPSPSAVVGGATTLPGQGRSLQVVRIQSYTELAAALKNRSHFAILNPYGEHYPTEGAGTWMQTLDLIADYVAHGGNWIEVGGASFYCADWHNETGKRCSDHSHYNGVTRLGINIGMDDIDEVAVPLMPTPAARDWFPPELLTRIATTSSPANRGMAAGRGTPVTPLVTDAAGRVWFGFQPLAGWGALWRLGGANPDKALALEVVPAALAHAFTTPPPPVPANVHLKVNMDVRP